MLLLLTYYLKKDNAIKSENFGVQDCSQKETKLGKMTL